MVLMSTVHCEAQSIGRAATDWGFERLPCNTARGLRTLTDRAGIVRRFCAAPGHESDVGRRFGRYVSEIADDPLGQAKARKEVAIERLIAAMDDSDDPEFNDDGHEGEPEWNGSFR